VQGLWGTASGFEASGLPALACHREVIAINLPRHCPPAEHDSGTFGGLAISFVEWLHQAKLRGVKIV
jgi:hypothetical protein